MRIISGKWRGRPLAPLAGDATRPTSDRVREALFSMLTSRLGGFDDLRVADLFAGTGALGLEALSRGAAHCMFVESDPKALKALRANTERLGAGDSAQVLAQPVEAMMAARDSCHLLLLDPPYRSGLGQKALTRLAAKGWIADGAWVSLETARDEVVDVAGFVVDTLRDHGKARLHLLRYEADGKRNLESSPSVP